QPKILRVLQEGEFERLGGTKTLKVDVRIVTASNQDLAVLVKEKRFREDLFYRLNVIAVTAPPLREKRGTWPCSPSTSCGSTPRRTTARWRDSRTTRSAVSRATRGPAMSGSWRTWWSGRW